MGLIIAAAVTTALALAALVVLLVRAADWRPAVLAFALALPLQPLAFYLVRLPIDGLLRTAFGATTVIVIVSLFYAPLTEEPAKWLVAAVPAVRRGISLQPVTMALAVGLGFAIGEIWMLAHSFLALPALATLPAWMFSGFVLERLEVCFLHGAFVAPAFCNLAGCRSFWLGGLVGMVLHFLLNLPIYFKQIDLLGLGESWIPILLLWVLAMVVFCVMIVLRLASRSSAVPVGVAAAPPR